VWRRPGGGEVGVTHNRGPGVQGEGTGEHAQAGGRGRARGRGRGRGRERGFVGNGIGTPEAAPDETQVRVAVHQCRSASVYHDIRLRWAWSPPGRKVCTLSLLPVSSPASGPGFPTPYH
jgi:hypothetical protein